MMGERRVRQDALFYEFSLERHVPERHLLRSIDRFVELDGLRQELAPFYSEMGRPSIDPELLIRFCGLGLDSEVPDHFDLLEEPAWPLSRQRSAAALVRDRPAALHRRGIGR